MSHTHATTQRWLTGACTRTATALVMSRRDPITVADDFHDEIDAIDAGHVVFPQVDRGPVPSPRFPWGAAGITALVVGFLGSAGVLSVDWSAFSLP